MCVGGAYETAAIDDENTCKLLNEVEKSEGRERSVRGRRRNGDEAIEKCWNSDSRLIAGEMVEMNRLNSDSETLSRLPKLLNLIS